MKYRGRMGWTQWLVAHALTVLSFVLLFCAQFHLCRTFQAESRSRASEEEARFYLEDANWNLGAALAQYRDDVEWEKAQKAGGAKAQPMHAMQGGKGGGPRFY